MLGKGVKFSDVLVAIAIIVPAGLLFGAALGYLDDRFDLSGGLRVVAMVAFTGIAGQIARGVVMRRVRSRSASRMHG